MLRHDGIQLTVPSGPDDIRCESFGKRTATSAVGNPCMLVFRKADSGHTKSKLHGLAEEGCPRSASEMLPTLSFSEAQRLIDLPHLLYILYINRKRAMRGPTSITRHLTGLGVRQVFT
jgi:hypothetical protein